MASYDSRRIENAPGPYFVDDSCISCGACWREAPKNFASHKLHTFAFVFSQPKTMLEEGLCLTAKKICPVNAIGMDG